MIILGHIYWNKRGSGGGTGSRPTVFLWKYDGKRRRMVVMGPLVFLSGNNLFFYIINITPNFGVAALSNKESSEDYPPK
jgi:hypothetical protein